MKFFTESARNYIIERIAKIQTGRSSGQRVIVMVPALPEQHLLSVADAVSSYCLADNSIKLTLKIAQVLTDDWSMPGREKARFHDWLDDRGSLTYYRNLPATGGKLSVVVLCGTDRVTDAGGLADFHLADLDSIWRGELGGSFKNWIENKFESSGIYVETKELKSFDRLVVPLLEHGRGDLLSISDWLEALDLNSASDARQAQRAMLANLSAFGLPVLTGFMLKATNTLSPYIEKAGAFFSYTLFIEPREREKALRAVDAITEVLQAGEDPGVALDDEDVRGPYVCAEDLLGGLKNYILIDDEVDRQKLLQCDFVTIIDKILKFRKYASKEKKESVRKVAGSPVEMVLTAVWQTLHDLYHDRSFESEAKVNQIYIEADFFKHDIEGLDDEEIDTITASTERARRYLARLIGGLDAALSSRLSLTDIDGHNIPVKSSLLSKEIPCKASRTAEPRLEFSVYLARDSSARSFRRRFAWRLPDKHSYRLAENLLFKANRALDSHKAIWKLPVFHLPYYEEMLRSPSGEETRRVLLHSIRDAHGDHTFVANLLSEEWLDASDPLLPKLKHLAEQYHRFVGVSAKKGLLGALLHGPEWVELRRSYANACQEVVESDDARHAPSAGMLMRAFLVVQRRDARSDISWHADAYESSGIITVLHPALLEMLQAQQVYLFSCFNYAANKDLASDTRKTSFFPHVWQRYVDLATIQAPLAGLLCNEEQNLDASVRGEALIHRIGLARDKGEAISTRLLLDYGANNNEEVFSDSEMFKETSESKLLLRLMWDYHRLHPHAHDGLSIAVFRNKEIQPVIAAVHHYLNKLFGAKGSVSRLSRMRPYAISVSIFTESSDDVDVSRWVEAWRERWQAAETEPKYQAYRECRFSLAHRLVERDSQQRFQQLINENFEADICVLYDFIRAGAGVNRFENAPPLAVTDRTLKFPILEKACCTVKTPAEQYKRARVISNRQFVLGAKHADLMHSLKNKSKQAGTIVLGTGDFQPWRGVIDALHEKTAWVICIDPNMDDRLLRPSTSGKEREIIGFGTGVGTHGEDNFTISTEQFTLADVHARISESISAQYAGWGWNSDDRSEIATAVLHEARKLSGLSLVRATGIHDYYIHDFMAYALTRKMLKADGAVLCDNLISLDAYRHWFDFAESARKPDLMWLRATIQDDNRLHLEVQLIECKMAQQSEEHLLKARSQINNGLRVLIPAFAPADGTNTLEDARPDRRYWWMQLHRLIASKAEIDKAQYPSVLAALERLAEGDYEISWNASVFAFWLNSSSASVVRTGQWLTDPVHDVIAGIYEMGSAFVKELAQDDQKYPITWSEFYKQADGATENICDTMQDIELPAGDDEDDDLNRWDEELADEIDEEGALGDLGSEGVAGVQPVADDVADGYSGLNDAGASIPELQHALSSETGESHGSHSTLTETPLSQADEPPGFCEDLEIETGSSDSVGVPNKMPERILLGTTVHGQRPVYWEFGHPDLANRHMLVFGTSGMGKTYAIQCLLCEMARLGQNSLIVDYTDGFLPSKIEPAARGFLKDEGQNFILKSPLPINPFKAQISYEADMEFKDTPYTVAKRVAAIFKSVYELGNQQFPVLIDAITEGIEQDGDGFNLRKLQEKLQCYISDGVHPKGSVQTTVSKLKPFISSNPFDSTNTDVGWNELFSDEYLRNRVFQFHKVDKHSARALIEFTLWDLYAFLASYGGKEFPKVVVLDEVQNLDLGPDAPVAKYLTEGRKHGLALITATQTVKGVGGVSDAKVSRLFQAEQKLFFKPTENEMREHSQLLHNAVSTTTVQEWATRLASLQKGECWVLGRSLNEATGKLVLQAQRIKITSLEERGFNG